MPIQSMWMCIITIYSSNMDGRSSQWWLTISTMKCIYHLGPSWPQLSKVWPPSAQVFTWVREHVNIHSQHVNVLNQFVYIQYGCGKQSAVVHSLNHDTSLLFGVYHNPILQNLAPICTGRYHSMWRCTNTLYTSNMDVGSSQQLITVSTMTPQCHLRFTWPQFSKFCPSPAQVSV